MPGSFLTVARVRRLAVAVGPSYRALILLGAYGGLRIGEMTGLRRKRLDLAAVGLACPGW